MFANPLLQSLLRGWLLGARFPRRLMNAFLRPTGANHKPTDLSLLRNLERALTMPKGIRLHNLFRTPILYNGFGFAKA